MPTTEGELIRLPSESAEFRKALTEELTQVLRTRHPRWYTATDICDIVRGQRYFENRDIAPLFPSQVALLLKASKKVESRYPGGSAVVYRYHKGKARKSQAQPQG
jgi:hypothetical protein